VGSYVCGFVYYASLEHLWKKGEQTSVVFMHVPPLTGKDDVAKGERVTLALIQALAESIIK
jgi:pyroglutamyl-peptidase